MKIGIIGSGAIGGNLGKNWAASGHEIFYSSRNPEKLKNLISETKGISKAGTVAEAVAFADVVLLAINYWTLDEALENMGTLEGKVVIDATNPYEYANGKLSRVIPDDISGAEVLNEKLPKALLAKAFSSFSASIIKKRSHEEPNVAVLFTATEKKAQETTSQLITDAGFAPVYFGKLNDSIPIELMGEYSGSILTAPEAKNHIKSD